jgi:hypothetical protein
MGTLRSTAALFAASFVLAAAPLPAETVDRTFAFETDKWFLLDDVKAGPVTLHRIQVARTGLGTKSAVLRPSNVDFLAGIEIRLEYTHTGTRSWKARFAVAILDDAGRTIDGYNGTETLADSEDHEIEAVRFATLKYGLEVARKLRVVIDCQPE